MKPLVYCGFQGKCYFKKATNHHGKTQLKHTKVVCTWSEYCNQQTINPIYTEELSYVKV